MGKVKAMRTTKKIVFIILVTIICLGILAMSLYIPYDNWFNADPIDKGVIILRGQSMLPTLKNNTICYTKECSFERGEIVIFTCPEKDEKFGGQVLIKRIVGLPNEEIEIREDGVYINGTLLNEDYTDRTSNQDESNSYNILKLSDNDYYVMGDNRSESYDSRDFGSVAKNNFIYSVTLEPNEHTQEVKSHYIRYAVGMFLGGCVIDFLYIALIIALGKKRTDIKKHTSYRESVPDIKPIYKDPKQNRNHSKIDPNTSKKKLKRRKRNF